MNGPNDGEASSAHAGFARLLAGDPGPTTALRALVRGPLRHLDAFNVMLFAVTPTGTMLAPQAVDRLHPRIPRHQLVDMTSPTPLVEAVRQCEHVQVCRPEWLARYPLLAPLDDLAHQEGYGDVCILAFPLCYGSDPLGGVALMHPASRWTSQSHAEVADAAVTLALWLRVRLLSDRVDATKKRPRPSGCGPPADEFPAGR